MQLPAETCDKLGTELTPFASKPTTQKAIFHTVNTTNLLLSSTLGDLWHQQKVSLFG